MASKKDLLALQATQITLLQATLAEVGAYIYTKDLNGCYTYANNLVLNLFGADLKDVIGKDDSHFFDLESKNRHSLDDRRILDHGETIESEEVATIKATDEMRIYWSVKKPIYDNQAKIIGLCGISTDITDRYRLERKLQKQNELLEIVLNNIDACVYMKDRQRTYLYVNDKTADLFGLKADEIIGKNENELLSKESADHFFEMDNKVFASNIKHAGDETFIDGAGKTHHYWTIKVPFKQEDGVQTLIGFSSDITKLYNLNEKLKIQATTDMLTGLFNRRYFFEQAHREISRSNRQKSPLSLLIIDIDRFKSINDKFGHPVGDIMLTKIAKNCSTLMREEDVLARIGGEEFGILLPNTSLDDAHKMAERIRHFQSEQKVTGKWDGSIKATISIGASVTTQDDFGFDQLYQRADKALYEAKDTGRNRVCCNE